MGTFKNKVDELKEQINSTYSSYAQTLTETYNGNYVNAIIYALRTMGKQARTSIKTIWIPIQPYQRYYTINPTLYTKDKVEYVKASDMSLVNIGATGVEINKAETTTLEAIERNTYLDWVKFAQYFRQSETGLKVNVDPGTSYGAPRMGTLLSPTAPNIFTFSAVPPITLPSPVPLAGDYLVNLDKIDTTHYCYDTVATAGWSSPTVTMTDSDATTGRCVASKFWTWAAGDKICVVTGLPAFISLTFECIPQFGYVASTDTTLSTEVPVLPQFWDDIDDLAMKFIFKILGQRDPNKINLYVGMVKSGLIRSEPEIIRDIKVRSQTIDSIEIEGYQPYDNRYGR